MRAILEVEGLTKRLGDFVLDGVSFALPDNCITGFIGVNGAGKTSTIKLLLGLMREDAGDIRFLGEDIRNRERAFKNQIGVVWDDGYFYPDLTLLEMKDVVAAAYNEWDEPQFRKLLERFGLQGKQRIGTLSKGMRMKYAIALAMSHRARLLVMDEPTSGLDPQVRKELLDLLLAYVAEGNSVFVSTHITSDLDKIADYLILLDQGKVVWEEEKDRLLDTHRIIKGGAEELTPEVRSLFLTLDESSYGFTGLTAQRERVCRQLRNVQVERPSVEDIMLGYIGRSRA